MLFCILLRCRFGAFSGQLGDGAAMYLGEVRVSANSHAATSSYCCLLLRVLVKKRDGSEL